MAGKEREKRRIAEKNAGNLDSAVRCQTSEAQSSVAFGGKTPSPINRDPETSVAFCIDVIFLPEMVAYVDLSGKIALVVDILRASSTITLALANGAQSVLPVLTPEAAFAEYHNKSFLLCGERHGKKIEGFQCKLRLSR